MKLDGQMIHRIADAAKLPARQREVLKLASQDLAPAEMADRLGVSVKTVYTHWARARAH